MLSRNFRRASAALVVILFLSVACYQFETPPHKSLSLVNGSIISSVMKQLSVLSVDKSLIFSSLIFSFCFLRGYKQLTNTYYEKQVQRKVLILKQNKTNLVATIEAT